MVLVALARLLGAHPIVAAGVALLIRSELGAAPWDVLHVGLAHATGLTIGAASSAVAAAAVAVAWGAGIRPGFATLVNVLLLGACVDAALAVVPVAGSPVIAAGYLAAGVAALGAGTGLYLGAELGSGPRDSLMVALVARRGWSTLRARITLELAVLVAGVLLGGRAGIGTVLYALAIGPAVACGIRILAKEHAKEHA